MDAKLAIGKGFSKKIVDLINRPDLVSMPGNPVFEVWSEIRKLLPDFQVVEGDEVMERSRQQEFFNMDEGFMRIDLDKDRALRTQTTSVVLDYLKAHPDQPCRIITAGRVWRDDEEDEQHLKMFHQLDLRVMGSRRARGGYRFARDGSNGTAFPGKCDPVGTSEYRIGQTVLGDLR